MGFEHPKRCSSIGGPRETGFQAETQQHWSKQSNVSKMGPDHPKRCSSIGGPRETGFRAEIPNIWPQNPIFRFSGRWVFLIFRHFP